MGHPLENAFISQWMARGSELEGRAVASYELSHDVETEPMGFVLDDSELIGCSPDRLIIGENGLLEVKCPSPGVHVEYMIAKAGDGVDGDYNTQVQGQLWLCERDFADVLAWHPELPEVVIRVERDDIFVKELAAHVRAFSNRLEEIAEDFKARGWIQSPKVASPADETGFLSQADVDWAMTREI